MSNLFLTKEQKKLVDLEFIKQKMMELATQSMSGQVKTQQIEVMINLAPQMVEVVEHVAERTGAEISDIYTQMCSINFQRAVSELKETTQEAAKGMDIGEMLKAATAGQPQNSDVMDKMKEFEQMTNQFSTVLNMMENLKSTVEKMETSKKNEEE